jgi:hypothetical protein
MDVQQLRNHIRVAFPAVPFYGPVTSCGCQECAEIRDGLLHKPWDEISPPFIDRTCSPMLLTPEAFTVFVPAYLLRALDDLSEFSVVAEFTVYSLCPNEPDEDDQAPEITREKEANRLLKRVQSMKPEQIQAIRELLLFVRENTADAEGFQPIITRALEKVWR